MIAEAVASLPGNSVLEVGVHAGPTMWAIAQGKEYQRLAGTELSDSVLAFAKDHLPQALGREVELIKAAADKLPFPDKTFDITVTNLVLVCVGPDDIEASLREILRVTKGYLVFGEPQAASAPVDKIDRYTNTTYWVRNYQRLLGVRASLVSRVPVPKEKQFGHLDEIAIFAVN
jgi:ubiquinone/menaquinone biosynthesis C-methylase UbiE